jgi:hypothetical protein
VRDEGQGSRIPGVKGSRILPLNHRHLLLVLLPLFVLPFLLPARASADGITAVSELNYSSTKTRTEFAGVLLTETKNDTFLHRHFINLDKTLYPNVKFLAGGIFEQTISHFNTDNLTSNVNATVKNGLLDLRQATHFISSGVGYNIREERTSSSGQPSVTAVRETYSANLGLRPEGMPTVDTLYLRTYTYDKERKSQDMVNDFLSLASKYDPYKDLELTAQVTLTDQKDRLQDLDVKTTNYSARAVYARKFGERVSAFTTYNFTRQETRTSAGGSGEVLFQVFPFSGLSALTDTPALVTLDLNPALIDGDLVTGAGINLGAPPPGGDDRPRNIGVDFIVPSEINTIYLWTDRHVPASVAGLFSWDIYVSSDNLNWTLFQTVPSAPFGTFDNRFEISFPNVTSRYIKVVTKPLSPFIVGPPGFDMKTILVTELQTFLRRPAEEVRGKTTQTTHVYDLDVKWRILDKPYLFYDMYYWSVISQPGGTRYILTNSLNLTHRLSRVFSGALRIAREDGKEPEPVGKRSANLYSASLTAVPLPTLYHSLVVSGRFEKTGQGSINTNSAFLNNAAMLYPGLNFNLSGGVSVATNLDGGRTVSTIVNSGVTAVPHPVLTLNINYSETNAKQTGGLRGDSSNFVRNGNLSISYTPFPALYIFTSFGVSAQTDRDTVTLQNYSVTWSPFSEGDLQFNFFYNESITSEGVKDRTITPGLRWFLRRNTTLDVSYSITTSDALIQKTETKVLSANLRMALL